MKNVAPLRASTLNKLLSQIIFFITCRRDSASFFRAEGFVASATMSFTFSANCLPNE